MYEMGGVELVLFIIGGVLVLVPVTLAISVLWDSPKSRPWKTGNMQTETADTPLKRPASGDTTPQPQVAPATFLGYQKLDSQGKVPIQSLALAGNRHESHSMLFLTPPVRAQRYWTDLMILERYS